MYAIVEFPLEKQPGETIPMAIISTTWIFCEDGQNFYVTSQGEVPVAPKAPKKQTFAPKSVVTPSQKSRPLQKKVPLLKKEQRVHFASSTPGSSIFERDWNTTTEQHESPTTSYTEHSITLLHESAKSPYVRSENRMKSVSLCKKQCNAGEVDVDKRENCPGYYVSLQNGGKYKS
ncbi:hypothetical protein FQR65_LT15971 [Abscondita terminalis]|nr:hypothetical protein FQR65_LT15971 [Abscondita terminalis]